MTTKVSAERYLNDIATMTWKPDPIKAPEFQVQMDALPEYRAMVKVIGSLLEVADAMEKDSVWLKYGDEGDRAVAQEIRGDADKIRSLVSYYLAPEHVRPVNKVVEEKS
jgi:hypothetical protein